jgi:hypothetical protein
MVPGPSGATKSAHRSKKARKRSDDLIFPDKEPDDNSPGVVIVFKRALFLPVTHGLAAFASALCGWH